MSFSIIPMRPAQISRSNDVIATRSLIYSIGEPMENKEKFVKNLISFLSERKLIERFKAVFKDLTRRDEDFEEKLKILLDSNEKPEDEVLWRKMLESEDDLLTQQTKEDLFVKFEETLEEIFQMNKKKRNLQIH